MRLIRIQIGTNFKKKMKSTSRQVQRTHCIVKVSRQTQQPTHPIAIPSPPTQTHSTITTHTMITRSKHNIHKPLQKMNLHTQLSTHHDLEPVTVSQALKNSQWRRAMADEFNTLITNGIQELVQPTNSHNLVGCKWIFHTK